MLDTARPQAPDGRVVSAAQAVATASAHPPTQAILVLGMHRSGTSAVARVLGMMGAYIGAPDELLPAHPQDNPTGYWERAEFNRAHDRFIEASGHRWNRLAGFDAHEHESAAAHELASTLRRSIDKLDAGGKPWLAKDPRLCLLLPQWQPLLRAPACVVVVRDPREIAASMHVGPRGTFTSAYVVALWEKYLRTLLMDLAGRPALFVSYAALLANPQAQGTRLLNGLRTLGVGGLHVAPKHELDSFLDARLQRSTAQSHVLLAPAQEALHAWLDRQCKTNAPITVEGFPEAPAPDAVLREFESAFDYQAELGRQRALGETDARLGRLEALLGEQGSERMRLLDETSAQRRQIENAHAEIAAQRRLVEQAHGELSAQRQLVDQAHGELSAQRQLVEQAHSELSAQRQLVDQAHGELSAQRQLVQQAHGELSAQRKGNEQARAEADALRSRLADAAQAHTQLQEQTAILTGDGELLRRQVAQLSDHAIALKQVVDAMHASWSWKIMAPLRGIANLLQWRGSAGLEQRFYRIYYAIPGLNATHKRRLILWLHEHAAWLTLRSMSYRFYEQARQLERLREKTAANHGRLQRMDAQLAKASLAKLRKPALISIVMPVYNVERRWLHAAVDSVRRQFYPHWELCIADDASTLAETREALDDIVGQHDRRIKLVRLKQNVGIAGASNAALKLAKGAYVGLLDNDDELTRDALLEVAQRIAAEQPDILYSDEDKLDENGKHVEPHFKPDYSADYLFSINYLCHFSVVRRALLEKIGGFRDGFDGAQDYDLLLRATEATDKVAHIPKVLYHWRRIAGSTAAQSAAKPHTSEAGRRALGESLARRGIDARAEAGPFPNSFHVRRSIRGEPLVSIIVPFRDKPELLAACADSILKKTRYRNFEFLGIDNNSAEASTHALMRELQQRDSRFRFIRYDAPFNYSAINNFAATHARGEHLLFLNNDTEIISPDWLDAMLEHSQRPEVGAVGAKLLYADDTLQHAGVIVGLGGVAGHAHLLLPADHPGYFARAQLTQNLSAVTFACAMTRRSVFEQMGGLNDRQLQIAFNDIDYCLRVREAGYLVVYTPNATLHHYESKSRGYEDTPEKQSRFGKEILYMQQRHAALLKRGDPYYNASLSLTQAYAVGVDYISALPD